jgi:hypothetical protein
MTDNYQSQFNNVFDVTMTDNSQYQSQFTSQWQIILSIGVSLIMCFMSQWQIILSFRVSLLIQTMSLNEIKGKNVLFADKYILLLICFVRMDFSEQSRIEGVYWLEYWAYWHWFKSSLKCQFCPNPRITSKLVLASGKLHKICLGLLQKKVSPGGRTPMKFRGTTNRFKLKKHPHQLFHILGKPPHQQI